MLPITRVPETIAKGMANFARSSVARKALNTSAGM
jgi:hypothetical protein